MFQVGFGLLLYHWVLYPAAILVVIPFIVNLFNGHGYAHNFNVIWGGVWRFLRFGVRKRD
jgi:hypothetical protein